MNEILKLLLKKLRSKIKSLLLKINLMHLVFSISWIKTIFLKIKRSEECKIKAPLASYFVTNRWRSWHKETGLQWLSLLLGDHNTSRGRERESHNRRSFALRSGDTVANAFTTHSPILTCDMHNCILYCMHQKLWNYVVLEYCPRIQ